MLAGDIDAVTGKTPAIVDIRPTNETVIGIGTLGASKSIDDLVGRKLVDTTGVKGVWEAYRVAAVANPWPGVRRALVVSGADRRGTAYGALSLSRAIGVSPVRAVRRHREQRCRAGRFPAVRGIAVPLAQHVEEASLVFVFHAHSSVE